MEATLTVASGIIAVALLFDFGNGWHDAANSIANVVSTRVLTPFQAVLLQLWVLLCGLFGAIAWDVFTWFLGLPTSSSHALIGGYGGAAVAAYGGIAGMLKPAGWTKAIAFIFISPLLGMIIGFLLMLAITWLFRRSPLKGVDWIFRRGQLISAPFYSLGHGGADAQKTMGIIAAVLVAANLSAGATAKIPLGVVLSCHIAMGLGTLSGGWRIVRTMGAGSQSSSLSEVSQRRRPARPPFSCQSLAASQSGATHTTGPMVGLGSVRRLHAVALGGSAMSLIVVQVLHRLA